MDRNWRLCIALYCSFCCWVSFAGAAQCDYYSTAAGPCDSTANDGSCADYFQIFATLEYQNISSPGYPNNYPDNNVCRWVVSACLCQDPSNPNGQFRVEIEVMDYDMQSSPSCTKDYLEIKDGKRLWDHKIAQYCGNKCASRESNITRSSNMQLLVSFQTDVRDPNDLSMHRGFFARYRCVAIDIPHSDDLVLGPVNYLLIAFSCLLAVLFGSAAVLLGIQEKRRSRHLVD